MKVYVLTRTVVSEKGGTTTHKPFVFLSIVDAKIGLLKDMHTQLDTFNYKLKEYIVVDECYYYSYYYVSKSLGFTIIHYKIWETEL